MKLFISQFLILVLLYACQSSTKRIESSDALPNIVFIFPDDLGYGDLGCFGAKDIATPNIDYIANYAIKFTDFYLCSDICSD